MQDHQTRHSHGTGINESGARECTKVTNLEMVSYSPYQAEKLKAEINTAVENISKETTAAVMEN
jgi:hypothetical protein